MRLAALAFVLLFVGAASAQTFRPLGGPWTRNHSLVGSTPDGRIYATSGSRLGMTTDGGQTWTVIANVAPRQIVADGSALLGAFSNGIRRSTDGGATWTPWGLGGLDVRGVAVGTSAYAITDRTLYRSDGNGAWAAVALPSSFPSYGYLRYVGAAGGTLAVEGVVFECQNNTPVSHYLRTRDGGATWTRTSGGGEPSGVVVRTDGTAWFASADGYGCLNIPNPGGLHVQAPDAAATTRISQGDVGGVTLDASGQPVTSLPGESYAGRFGRIAVSTGGTIAETKAYGECDIDPPCLSVPNVGLLVVRNGQTVQTGFVPSDVLALAVDGDDIAAAANGAVFTPHREGWKTRTLLAGVRAFVPVPWQDGITVALSPSYAAGPYSLQRGLSYPNCVTFLGDVSCPDPLVGMSTASSAVVGDRIVSAGNLFYTGSGVFVTSDSQFSILSLEHGDIATIGGVDDQTVYAGAVEGIWYNNPSGTPPLARIFRSDDRGSTWVADDTGMTAWDVYAFTSLGEGATRLDLAGTSGGVFVRTPGEPWHAEGSPDRTIYTFSLTPVGLLAGTSSGLYVRASDGAWTPFGSGLDGRRVYAILATDDGEGAWLGVGTDAGVFATRPFGVASEASGESHTRALAVSTLPNPARGHRVVRIKGLGAESVHIQVYDLLGRLVSDLGAFEAPAGGRLDVTWDAAGLPVGVYVVHVQTGRERVTTRAVVAR